MSDLELLRDLTSQIRPPAIASLRETARQRSRRATRTALGGGALAVLVVVGGVLVVRGDERSAPEPGPQPDQNQKVIEADYGDEAVHRYETSMASNTQSEHAGETDLSVTVDVYGEFRQGWWCDGDPEVYYLVQITGSDDEPDPVWRAGGACGGTAEDRGNEGRATQPPPPSDALNWDLGRFMPFPGDVPTTRTVRIVLTDAIPQALLDPYCFDLPGGPVPENCLSGTPVNVLESPGDVTFGAVIYNRPVEYVATVAGARVEAQASYDGTEYLFAGGVESVPGKTKVTLHSDRPGYLYVVQSDPQGDAECQLAFEAAKAEGREFVFEGDSQNWGCTIKEAELRLLVDGQPVREGQEFSGGGGIFDFGSAVLDTDEHEVTLEFVRGDPRVSFGLVLFEEAD